MRMRCLGFVLVGLLGCSDEPPATETDDTGATLDSTATDSLTVDSVTVDSVTVDSVTVDSVTDSATDTFAADSSADTFMADSAADGSKADTFVADSSPADTAVPDASDASVSDTLVADSGTETSTDAGPLTCGSPPRVAMNVYLDTKDAAPPAMNVTSSICSDSYAVAMATGASTASGSTKAFLATVPQFLTATSPDTFPIHSYEFTNNTTIGGVGITLETYAKTSTLAPPGFSSSAGKAAIHVKLSKKSGATTPCDTTDGITIALESTSAGTHPGAVVYYESSTGYTTTGPSSSGKTSAYVVLSPTGAGDYVKITGTKPSCKVDTALTAADTQYLIGISGRIPVVANELSVMSAIVGN